MSMFEKPFEAPGARTYLPPDKTSIRRFQVYHKLPTTGRLDGATMAKMRATNTSVHVTEGGPSVADQMDKFGGDRMTPRPSRGQDGGPTTATQQRRFKGDKMNTGRPSGKTFKS